MKSSKLHLMSTPQEELDEISLPVDENGVGMDEKYQSPKSIGHRFKRRTPLPVLQLFILGLTRLSELIAYTQIFPYINQMMEDLKVTDQPAKVGYYSGLVDSIFALCQLLTIFQWSKLSDRVGRKPVILFGLLGVALSTTLFGVSTSLLWAIASRSLAGLLSGNAAVMDSVIAEITDETNQAQAFPLRALSWNLGSIIGPVIGGNLAMPEQNWPESWGKYPLLRTYPYLLPCAVSASMTAASILFGLACLKESFPAKERQRAIEINRRAGTKRQPSIQFLLSIPAVRCISQSFFLLSVLSTGFDVVFVLMAYTPVCFGGLSRSPEEIGYVLAFTGITGAVMQVIAFPVLQRRFGNIQLYRNLMCLWPIVYLLMPCLNLIARCSMPHGASEHDSHYLAGPVLWFCILGVLILLRTATVSFSVMSILINNTSPSPDMRGAMFGLTSSVACIAKAAAPTFVSILFAFSKKHQIMGGNLVWVVMCLMGLAGVRGTYDIVDGAEQRDNAAGK